jgi:iron(III) transport system ATP-binding protein
MDMKHKASSVVFEKVTKRFGTTLAVDQVSFIAEAGTLVTLLGPSGCGKTTNLRMIAGLEIPTAGKIMIGNKDVTKLPPTERDVTMVFQSYALFPHMNVIENVSYGLTCAGMKKQDAYDRASHWLDVVGLRGFEARLSSELSGGQQQRVAVARALVLEPQVLLFDEPLSNLDAKLRRKMRQDIRDLQQRLGITAVYVTHDQSEALAISDKIIVMEKARIAQQGPPRSLYEQPQNLFVANFMGDANVVGGQIDSKGKLRVGSIQIPFSNKLKSVQGAVQVSIRPESIILNKQQPQGSFMEGTIKKLSYLGGHMEYEIQTSIGRLFVIDWHVSDPHEVNQSLYIHFSDHGIAVLPTNNYKEKGIKKLNRQEQNPC